MATGTVEKLPPLKSTSGVHLSPRSQRKYEGLRGGAGPSYTLALTAQKGGPTYNLPPATVLKPYQDTHAGGLETWPAHATESHTKTALYLNKDKQLCVVDEEAAGKAAIVPKPKFLEDLETFLKKELKALGATRVEANDLRLQAHREVFEYLIEDFKTYRPILSAIKNEYEMMINHQSNVIRQLEPLKQMLVTVSEQCDQKIMGLRDQERQEMVDLKKENQRLYQRIDELKQAQGSLQTQVEKLQEELAAEYLRYRDECDARKLLVADINELRYQQEDLMMSKQNMNELEEEQDDPQILKIALKQAREDEMAMSKRLNEMIANYGDVIPRRDFESLQATYRELEEKMELIKNDFITLKGEHDISLQQNQEILKQRDDFYVEAETLKKAATPRPDWSRCADYVAGGIVRWKELSDNKSSSELVNVLLNEIAGGGTDVAGAEYFEPKGTGEEVPEYLRSEAKVRNRRLGKRDCSLLIRDIWREKTAHDAEKQDGSHELLSTFMHIYLTRRFALPELITEWAYNLHDAAERYAHDERIGMFYTILTGEKDEELHHSQQQMIQRLHNALTKADVDKGNLTSLSKEDLSVALKEQFPNKPAERITALCQAAETQLDARDIDTLEYKALFIEDDEGKTGIFLDELKRQMKAEHQQYVDDIMKELGEIESIGVEDLKKALTTTDPDIELSDLDRYLCWVYKVTDKNQLSTVEAIDRSHVIHRLQNGSIKRLGARVPTGATPPASAPKQEGAAPPPAGDGAGESKE